MKKLIYILVALVLVGAVAFKLIENKKEMATEAAVAEIKSEAISVQVAEPKLGKIDKSFRLKVTSGRFKLYRYYPKLPARFSRY
ncbi:MAG: hypothetical protein M3142_00620 [Bacteroidota bacterium]|nr:hypothetical protein [Bacteroidota bacterium]